MAWRLDEPVIYAIYDRLVAELGPAIEGHNAGNPDVTLDELEVFDHPPTARELEGFSYQGVALGDLGSEFEDDTGFCISGTHRVALLIYLSSHDAGDMARRMRRMLALAVEVVMRDRDLPIDNFEGMGIERTDYGPALDALERPRLKRTFAAAIIWVRTEDT